MNDQVQTATGYQYGGQNYNNETRTDSQGNKYTVAIPVSSVMSAPAQPQFQTPTPAAPTNYGSITTDLASQQDFALQQFQNQQDQMVSDTSKLQNALLGEGAFKAQQAEASGLNAANQAAIQKAAEISALGKQAAAAQQENISQGRQLGSVSSFVAGQSNEIERNRAIKALSLGAELDAIQGNIAVAQSKVDQAVEAQYAPMKQALANKLQMFELNKTLYSQMSDREQKIYTRAQAAAEQEQKKLDQQIADKKDVQNMIIEATPNAPTTVIANAKKLADSGASKLAVAQALGVYGGDYLKNELLKEQINKAKADIRETDAKISALNTKTDGTNIAGKPMKVSNTEITNLNETLTARDSVTSLVNQFKQNIKDYGTQTLYGTAAGDREALRTSLLLAIKNMEKTGALDAGTINVLEGTIPSSKFFATQAAQTAALDTLLNTVNSKTNSYVSSYKGTSAETDPRTKRAYEEYQIVSSGNKAADDYAKLTMKSLNNVNTSLSTPNAMNAGFVDNQK